MKLSAVLAIYTIYKTAGTLQRIISKPLLLWPRPVVSCNRAPSSSGISARLWVFDLESKTKWEALESSHLNWPHRNYVLLAFATSGRAIQFDVSPLTISAVFLLYVIISVSFVNWLLSLCRMRKPSYHGNLSYSSLQSNPELSSGKICTMWRYAELLVPIMMILQNKLVMKIMYRFKSIVLNYYEGLLSDFSTNERPLSSVYRISSGSISLFTVVLIDWEV